MNTYIVGIILPVLTTLLFRSNNHPKHHGVLTDTTNDPGITVRNKWFDYLVETIWEGVSIPAELFKEACRRYREGLLFGTRLVISKELETSSDGRMFEKVQLGEYEWLSYAEAFEVVSRFGSGLAALGHGWEQHAVIYGISQIWFLI